MKPRSLSYSLLLAGGALALTAVVAAAEPAAEAAPLIEVNGEPILPADIDQLIMQSHAALSMDAQKDELLLRILEKAVNDRLILQEARAMGLDEEAELVGPLEDLRLERAWKAYARENFIAPSAVEEAEIAAHFERFYARILIRQLSVRTEQECHDMIRRIRAGESMEALAQEHSLDTRKPFGGLHNFKLYRDLEVELREAQNGLSKGELSAPFPYRESWSVIRLEDSAPADPAERSTYEAEIVASLLNTQSELAWARFIEGLQEETPIVRDESVLSDIRADADQVFRGEFLRSDPRPALWIAGGRALDGTALRKAISRTAMEMGDRSFESILDAALEEQSKELVLVDRAMRGGYPDREPIARAFARELDQSLIEAYLNINVIDKLRFSREEFQAYYDENPDQFAGDPEVQLSFLFVEDEALARKTADRLLAGADFDFVRREIEGAGSDASGSSKFASEVSFSDAVRAAIAGVKAGLTTQPVPLGDRFMIIRVDGRRPGPVKPMADVEMQIREVMFQRAFKQALDAHLALLRERSEIVRHEDRIAAYFAAE